LHTFFAAANKVGAAPHRGEANRPLRNQGKANALGKQPKAPHRQNQKRTKTQTGSAKQTAKRAASRAKKTKPSH
jgi:hypothetical protein